MSMPTVTALPGPIGPTRNPFIARSSAEVIRLLAGGQVLQIKHTRSRSC